MNLKIAVLPGDGIGPEIMPEAINVLNVIAKKFRSHLHLQRGYLRCPWHRRLW